MYMRFWFFGLIWLCQSEPTHMQSWIVPLPHILSIADVQPILGRPLIALYLGLRYSDYTNIKFQNYKTMVFFWFIVNASPTKYYVT